MIKPSQSEVFWQEFPAYAVISAGKGV